MSSDKRKEHRKIAKDDVIRFVLKEIMKEKVKVESQRELTELVNKRLSRVDKLYSVSNERIRLMAVDSSGIKVSVKTREGRTPEKCPVCLHSLKKRKMKNLKGRSIVYGYLCKNCGFEAHENDGVPAKYLFEYEK